MSELVNTRIGVLPREWRVQPLAEITIKIQDGTHFSPKSEDGPYRYVTSKNIQFGRLDLSDCGWISQQEHDAIYARCDVKYGDVLLTKDGANTGNASLNDQHEAFSLLSSVAILRTDGVAHHAGFILQYLLSPLGQRRLKDLMSGNAITRLTLQKIKAFETPVPSATEQRRIAEILSTLDETIEETEALIAKYQQIKAGLMHDLFTRGVTPDGKLRPTRAEAPHLYKESPLGWIPNEWEVYSLSTIAESLIDGPFGSNLKTEHYVLEPGVRVVRLQNIQEGLYNDADRAFVSQRHADYLSRNIVNPGDVLIAALGEDNYPPGRACCYPEGLAAAINKADCYRLRCKREFAVNAYVMHFLNTTAARNQVRRFEQGVTRRRTNLGNFRRVMIAVTKMSEQERILELLADSSNQIESTKTFVEKLVLEKHGLMHDLLTGRVRVKVAA